VGRVPFKTRSGSRSSGNGQGNGVRAADPAIRRLHVQGIFQFHSLIYSAQPRRRNPDQLIETLWLHFGLIARYWQVRAPTVDQHRVAIGLRRSGKMGTDLPCNPLHTSSEVMGLPRPL